MEQLVIPLQDKLEDWKKSTLQLDKDHSKAATCRRTTTAVKCVVTRFWLHFTGYPVFEASIARGTGIAAQDHIEHQYCTFFAREASCVETCSLSCGYSIRYNYQVKPIYANADDLALPSSTLSGTESPPLPPPPVQESLQAIAAWVRYAN
ncbi:hypothetical protein HPB52_025710 [Rhipicephalus sanguineus]|uniref:Uncharacterized protein n=1 Tax=Rhipicephalus sanguineus TaxID=34632 RepID=A0A9D4TCK9_RHISA|nr:hypothetical protein HPB52_025710 [Rhipicephalus sanguineus]